jgi:site-specific recombinase XerD
MDALKELAHALNTTPDEVDRKLRNINSQYLRGHAFTEKMMTFGADMQFHTKWFGHSLLTVLM